MNNPKRKSHRRWEQGRELYSKVCVTLPTPSHVAVLMFCWFHGSGPRCRFAVSHSQIAAATCLGYERARKVVAELVEGGVIENLEPSKGRGFAPVRMITGKPYLPQNKVVVHNHPKQKRVVAHNRKGGCPQP